jgi:hypothetical protein
LIGFLCATLALFALARIWDHSRVIHFNMEIALLGAHLCLLPPGIHESSVELCRFLSIMIHFFHLACFTFMFLESLHLYALVGWVVPRFVLFLYIWQGGNGFSTHVNFLNFLKKFEHFELFNFFLKILDFIEIFGFFGKFWIFLEIFGFFGNF